MEQLILHLFGDYVLQSQYMADNKTKSTRVAGFHALVYSLPFLLITSGPAWWVIFVTHWIIDRFGLARYVVWFKNRMLMPHNPLKPDVRFRWSACRATGYPAYLPAWLATGLLIAADNTLHLSINYLAIKYL